MSAPVSGLVRAAVPVAIAVALALGAPAPLVAPAFADEAGITLSATHDAEQVRAAWASFKPTYDGTPFSVVPSTSSPFAPGGLRPEFVADGLGIINFARYLAGVPSDVTIDPTRATDAQYGAVLLAASNFSHAPDQPAGMTDAFYTRALSSTTQSNIGWGFGDAESFQRSCLADSDAGNITHVGHRRWLLNPYMRVTGIGYAGNRLTTYAFDSSRAGVDFSAVAWPSAGAFPVEFMTPATAWSVTLNPARYDWDPSGQTVTLRRVADGRTWTFSATDRNTAGEYFAVSSAYYGVPNAFIFRPDPASVTYAPGDEFDVTLSGGIYLQGTTTPTSVTYRTTFMSLVEPAKPPVFVTLTAAASIVGYGGSTTLTGTLESDSGAPLAGASVALQISGNGSTWSAWKTVTTDGAGAFSVATPGLVTRRYFRAASSDTLSAKVAVTPRVWLSTPYASPTMYRGRTYTAYGYLKPRHAAGSHPVRVNCYRYEKKADGTYGYVFKKGFAAKAYDYSTYTKYVASISLPSAGRWRIRTSHAADSLNAATSSPYRSITVK